MKRRERTCVGTISEAERKGEKRHKVLGERREDGTASRNIRPGGTGDEGDKEVLGSGDRGEGKKKPQSTAPEERIIANLLSEVCVRLGGWTKEKKKSGACREGQE